MAVPTDQHFAVTRDLLEGGVSVLVEKPMTPTLEEARELFAIARRAGVVLHVGHVERYNGAVQELRKIVERPILIESRRLGPFAPRVQQDTVVMDLMIHDIDIVLNLVRSPTALAVRLRLVRALRGAPTWPASRSASTSGAIAIITASRATEEKIRTLAITQPDAYIVLDYSDQSIEIRRRAAQEYSLNREAIRYRQASFVEHVFVHKDNPLKHEILHLVRACRRMRAGGAGGAGRERGSALPRDGAEIERMIREGRTDMAFPDGQPWSARSR